MPSHVPWAKRIGNSDHKLLIVSCIFASLRVLSSIQLVLYANYAFIIMGANTGGRGEGQDPPNLDGPPTFYIAF